TFPDSVWLLYLNDCASPIGHAVGNIDVHDDARLHPLTKLEHRGFADSGVDVVVVESVDAQGEDNRFRIAASRSNGGDVEGRSLVGFSHVTGPFRMKVETALDAGLLRLCGFETAVTRIDVTLENDFGVGQGHCVNRA